MKSPRIRVGLLMSGVAVVAVNLAIGRAIYAYGENEYYLGEFALKEFVFLCLVPQVALVALTFCRGRRRAFWVGFFASSLLVMLSRVWFWYDPPITSNVNPTTGIEDPNVFYRTHGCAVAPLWDSYGTFASYVIENYINDHMFSFQSLSDSTSAVIMNCELEIVYLMPQLILALVGGLMARLFVAQRCKWHSRRLPVPCPSIQ